MSAFWNDEVYDKKERFVAELIFASNGASRLKNKKTVGKAEEENDVLCTRRHKGVRIL